MNKQLEETKPKSEGEHTHTKVDTNPHSNVADPSVQPEKPAESVANQNQPDQGRRDAAANPIDKDGNKIQTTEQQHIANAEPGRTD